MASFTITKRQKANGSYSYRCGIVVKKKSTIIHREYKTFSKKETARTWGIARCSAIEEGEILKKDKVIPIRNLLDLYFNNHELWEKIGRAKQYVIKMLMDCKLIRLKLAKKKERTKYSPPFLTSFYNATQTHKLT